VSTRAAIPRPSSPSSRRRAATAWTTTATGPTDLDDLGCDGPGDLSERTPLIACDDGLDNDGDGAVDYGADPGCKNALSNFEAPACQNGLDDDGDGKIDFDGGAAANGGVPLAPADPECPTAWHHKENAASGCGLGSELLLALPLLAALSRRRRRPRA
jgi:hypothetical protein